ncbi:MAG TPA: gamma-glutamylcyclotransferase family protein [Hyphomicrobiaceae bacterium]|nr:gamma-glutamylcyclotransferase family protein [Hyphomicrobiaceae bacterium]
MTNPNLFVYGTLMSAAGHPMAARLAREATLLGPASIQGRLYRIAWYPGVVDTPNAEERVHGELYALTDPVTSFAWLDAYEGLAGHGDSEYARLERPARPLATADVMAWVYLYQREPDARRLIADGRWTAPAK